MIRVDFSDERWLRAMQKAVTSPVTPELREVKPLGRVYAVSSSSGEDTYLVVLQPLPDGRTLLSCNCPAGTHDRPCWHAALVWLTWSREAVEKASPGH